MKSHSRLALLSVSMAALLTSLHPLGAQVTVPYTNTFEFDTPGYNDPDFTVTTTFPLQVLSNFWEIVQPGINSGTGLQSVITSNSSTTYNCAEVQTTGLPAPQGFTMGSDFQNQAFSTSKRSYYGLLALGNHPDLGLVGNGTGYGSFVWAAIQMSASSGSGPGSLNWVNFLNGSGNNTGISLGTQSGANLPMNTNDIYHLTLTGIYDVSTNLHLTLTATDVTSNKTATLTETISYSALTNHYAQTTATPLNGTYFGYCDREDSDGNGVAGPFQTEIMLQDNFTLAPYNGTVLDPALVLDTQVLPFAARFVGATASNSASFSGTQPIYYTWQYGGTNLAATNNITTASTTDANLVLTNLQLTNAGYYRLFASNSVSTAASSWALLTVVTPPANPVIDVDVRNGIYGAYQGQGVLGTVADLWNVVDGSTNAATNANIRLFDSTGAPTSVTLTKTATTATTINSSLVLPLFNQFAQTTSNMTVTLAGLETNAYYNLVVYSIGGSYEGGIVSGAVNGVCTGGAALIANTGWFTNGVNYVQNNYALSDGSGTLTFSIAPIKTSTYGDLDGLQLTLSAAPPTLNLQAVAGGQLQLSWPQGTLLQAVNVSGPWTTNTATSPYTLTPTAAQMFYRLQIQ
jgi:hypothetical protein